MKRDETIKLLSILKAAYPNSYKGMTKDEANGMVSVWTMQFANIPANIVFIAVNKIISKSPFPPSISEVKDKLRGLYYEATEMLRAHEYATEGLPKIGDDPNEETIYIGEPLDAQTLATVRDIIRVTEPMRSNYNNETSLSEILSGGGSALLIENKKGE